MNINIKNAEIILYRILPLVVAEIILCMILTLYRILYTDPS